MNTQKIIVRNCTNCGKKLQFDPKITEVYDLIAPLCDTCDEQEYAKEKEYLRKAGMLKE